MKIEVTMKYVQSWEDHLGRRRYRFRRAGYPRVELPVDSDPASPEFQAAYHAAMKGEKTNAAVVAVVAGGGSGSVRDAITQYLDSTTFHDAYADSTKSRQRSLLNSISRLVGNLPLAQMDRNWIGRWLETSSTRGAQKNRLISIKPLFKWALIMRLITVDPTASIRVKAKESAGHHTWTDDEVEQYRVRHPLGTMARLALELMLNLASRRGDAIVLGRQHLKEGWLVYTQEKNRKRKPAKVETPIAPTLLAAIEACSSTPESLTFLTNEWGRPFAKQSFGRWFRQCCDEAGLPKSCVPHGLRKAGCRIMAESNCTPHEIAAVSGHRTLKEVERYTAAADRKRLAERAQAKVANAGTIVSLRGVSA
jgi:site-specific recombinase XerD